MVHVARLHELLIHGDWRARGAVGKGGRHDGWAKKCVEFVQQVVDSPKQSIAALEHAHPLSQPCWWRLWRLHRERAARYLQQSCGYDRKVIGPERVERLD